MQVLTLLALCIAAVSGAGIRSNSQRIWGGYGTNIQTHPFMAALVEMDQPWSYLQTCAGTILNNRAVLTVANCITNETLDRWRVRVGSSDGNYGGIIHTIARHIVHPLYTSKTMSHNIAVLHVDSPFIFSNLIRPASIAGPNYTVADNQDVLAVGWGYAYACDPSLTPAADRRLRGETIRQVPFLTISQDTCRNTYAPHGIAITDNMLCAGWHDWTAGHCAQDYGTPLLHNNVVIGVFTFRMGIADAAYQSVHTRVSNYTSWITSNA